jgi:integrative and conjugative element protein (TIGR02256 family)
MPQRIVQLAKLPRRLLNKMEQLADNANPLETGGAIMGYVTDSNHAEVAITSIVGPGSGAVQTRISFEPDYDYQYAEIEKIYFASGRRHTYLGDWHTHPDSAAELSRKDKAALRCIAACEDARAPQPIMLILGYGSPWDLHIWRLVHGQLLGVKYPKYVRMEVKII